MNLLDLATKSSDFRDNRDTFQNDEVSMHTLDRWLDDYLIALGDAQLISMYEHILMSSELTLSAAMNRVVQ